MADAEIDYTVGPGRAASFGPAPLAEPIDTRRAAGSVIPSAPRRPTERTDPCLSRITAEIFVFGPKTTRSFAISASIISGLALKRPACRRGEKIALSRAPETSNRGGAGEIADRAKTPGRMRCRRAPGRYGDASDFGMRVLLY
jgi:hypothetical protein